MIRREENPQPLDVYKEMKTDECRSSTSFGSLAGNGTVQQELVTAHFEATAKRWDTLYEERDIFARIFQRRLAATLNFVDKLALAANSEILDVGCGAGLAAVALAERGHFVEAVDVASAMLAATREHASQAGVAQRVRASIGDIHRLDFADNTFNVVLAIGITAWLQSLQDPLRELARVLRPGGYLVISAANGRCLHRLLDPRLNPALAPAIFAVGRILGLGPRKVTPNGAHFNVYSLREFDSILARAGFKKLESMTLGFGPFSLLGRKLLPRSFALTIDHYLQQLADGGVPFIRSAGRSYLVLARQSQLRQGHNPN